jgi:acyl-CoA synthetase (AMP-forming)/AMP-acid ligase II
MERNLADIFEIVVDAVPEREALVAGSRRLTFAALDERANLLADVLTQAGVGPGDHVAAYLYNGTEFVETMLAVFKLQAAVVNVNYRYVAAEVEYVLGDSDAKAIVYDTGFARTLAEVDANLPRLRARLAVGGGDAVAGRRTTRRRSPPAPRTARPDCGRAMLATCSIPVVRRAARRASYGATPTFWPRDSGTSTVPRPARRSRRGPGPVAIDTCLPVL